jgi:hypothetical protein
MKSLVCTAASGANDFTSFGIMGFEGINYVNITVNGRIFHPLNMTTTIKNIKLEE